MSATIKAITKSNYQLAFPDATLNYFCMQKILHFYQPTSEMEDINLLGLVFAEISLTWVQDPDAEKLFFQYLST